MRRRSKKCQPRMVRPLSRDHRSVSVLSYLCALGMGFRGPAERPVHRPFMPALRHGTKDAVLRFPIGRCEGTLGSAPFRRLAELVGFGDKGTRDCATPNSTDLDSELWSFCADVVRSHRCPSQRSASHSSCWRSLGAPRWWLDRDRRRTCPISMVILATPAECSDRRAGRRAPARSLGRPFPMVLGSPRVSG
jgi:hypothetical protein